MQNQAAGGYFLPQPRHHPVVRMAEKTSTHNVCWILKRAYLNWKPKVFSGARSHHDEYDLEQAEREAHALQFRKS